MKYIRKFENFQATGPGFVGFGKRFEGDIKVDDYLVVGKNLKIEQFNETLYSGLDIVKVIEYIPNNSINLESYDVISLLNKEDYRLGRRNILRKLEDKDDVNEEIQKLIDLLKMKSNQNKYNL
jgi:hypothetical protein